MSVISIRDASVRELPLRLVYIYRKLNYFCYVLMDREFDSQHIPEMLSQRGLSYVIPKRILSRRAPSRIWIRFVRAAET